MINMDIIDKKIICMLDKDCRTPISQIAKQLRINRNVVTYRINNLKKTGIIRKYVTSISLGKLGYNSYKIYFKINQPNKCAKLINYLKDKNEVVHLIRLEGKYNLSCVFAAKNIVDLDNFLTTVKTKFENFVRETQISIVVYSKIFKFEKLLLNNKNKPIKIEKYSSKEKNISLDNTDKKILRALSQNANLSYIELMEKTKLSLDVIKYRMKKLKTNTINSFRVLFDFNKLGYFHYTILIKTNNMKKSDEEKLVAWSASKRNVMYCTKRIGNYDFEINIAITDISDLRNFMNELQEEFSEKINTRNTVLVSDILKLNYTPF